ncbi:DUF3298 and DUF4163 domain-containing protein [Clostridioides mangenotii]|uniref:DUF3298 and DUF4163 domain-containing protein n=1 Tax=Metaclostridioides mangenotii TaxID=1540 RepID=UPI001C10B51C|nr:DUF3298 and DUF4163 domain-containing protein [Clostridioides mangenotii]MBU5307393.1 DUF3298 and DUF4163 domain-containing protein [Clostridioides mangenotii]
MIYKKRKRHRKLDEFIFLIGFFIVTVTVIVYSNKHLNLETSERFDKSIESNYTNTIESKNKTNNKSLSNQQSSKSTIKNIRMDKSDKYINSVLNVPNVVNENKELEKIINDKINADINSFFEKNYKEAKDNYINNNIDGVKFEANTDYKVVKNTKDVLSIIIRYYNYSGGAHGYYEDIAYNIDIKSGKFLRLSDLFLEQSNYKEIINKEIESQIKTLEMENVENKGIYQFKSISDNQKYYFSGNDIVIYFDLYDIAPYAAGIPEFVIDGDLVIPIIKKEYINLFK